MSSSTLPTYLTTQPPPVTPQPTTVRLQALYASTSAQRQSNPTGYSANVSWWSALVEELLRSGYISDDHLILKVDDGLLGKLEWNGGRPRGLGGFVERLSNTSPSILHPIQSFNTSLAPLHAQPSITSRLIGRPLYWAFSQLNPFGSSEEAVVKEDTLWTKYGKGKEYVHMPLLEQAAAAFTTYIRENPPTVYSDSLYSSTAFNDEYASICFPSRQDGKKLEDEKLSKRDMETLLKWLTRDCGVIVTSGDVIKVLGEGEKAADHPITEADKGTVTIRDTLNKLGQQVEAIEKQIERCQQKAKHHLSLSQKSIALSHLKSKKQLEDLLLKRISSSQQLSQVLRSIDQAKGDIEIMAAYEQSTSTLKTILSNPNLDLDHVERTTEALAEVMSNQEEIDTAVRIGGEVAVGSSSSGAGVDDDDLKRELEEMVKEEKEAQAQAQKVKEAEARVAEQSRAERAEKEKEKAKMVVPAATGGSTSTTPGAGQKSAETTQSEAEAERVWRERYEEAQQRKKEEGERAEMERMKRQQRMAAE